MYSINNKKSLVVRNPKYIRPWLYVLDSLNGYIKLAEKIYKKKKSLENNINWNFSPNATDHVDVGELIKNFKKHYFFRTVYPNKKSYKETEFLRLNSEKARKKLNWKPAFNIKKMVKEICNYNQSKIDIKLIRKMVINFMEIK